MRIPWLCKYHASDHASVQVEKQVSVLTGEMGRSELQGLLSIKNRDYFRTDYLNPAINTGYIELTIPDKPNSQNQKYRLTAKGIALKEHLKDGKWHQSSKVIHENLWPIYGNLCSQEGKNRGILAIFSPKPQAKWKERSHERLGFFRK